MANSITADEIGNSFAGNVSHVPTRSSASGTLLELVPDVNRLC
ncbi:hypothetical protein ACLK1T_28110 [Escherichia coli]